MKTSPSGSRYMTTCEALSLALERGTIFNRRAIDIHEAKEVTTMMRAKLKVADVQEHVTDSGEPQGLYLTFNAVAANSYPDDGSDENNTFARWTPSLELEMYVANPDLFGKFTIGQQFYVDFTPAE